MSISSIPEGFSTFGVNNNKRSSAAATSYASTNPKVYDKNYATANTKTYRTPQKR